MKTGKKGQAIETIHSFVYLLGKQSAKIGKHKGLKKDDRKTSISDQEVLPTDKK